MKAAVYNPGKALFITVLAVIALLYFVAVPVMAESTASNSSLSLNESLNVNPGGSYGISPASPFYFIQNAMDRIRIMFASGPAAKAETAAQIAQSKMLQAISLAKEGKANAAEKAAFEYQKYVNISVTSASRISDEAGNESALNSIKTISQLQNRLEEQNYIMAHHSAGAGNDSSAKNQNTVQNTISTMLKNNGEASISLEDKKNNLRIRYSIESNSTLQAGNNIVHEADVKSGLIQGRIERQPPAEKEHNENQGISVNTRERETVSEKNSNESKNRIEADINTTNNNAADTSENGNNTEARNGGNESPGVKIQDRMNETENSIQNTIRNTNPGIKSKITGEASGDGIRGGSGLQGELN